MKLTGSAAALALAALPAAQAAKEVFAHIILGNMPEIDVPVWEDDMRLAMESSIDAFVLNVAAEDPNNDRSIRRAFEAANNVGFKLFFSLDYLGNRVPWKKEDAIAVINQFASDPAYFKHDGERPFVSTFQGVDNTADWPEIKEATNAFFVPDWSALEPTDSVSREGGVVDGLFLFDSWPEGDNNITTAKDEEYKAALGDKAYMMAVSPWFFTNLPGFNKNWFWRGDELWHTRWQQAIDFQPEFVQILTWNDFGESHYIGPVRKDELGLFESAKAPINYVENMTHDGFRKFLPFYIQQYKNGGAATSVLGNSTAFPGNGTSFPGNSTTLPANGTTNGTVSGSAELAEGIMAYYRTTPALLCPNGGTSGNDADHGEVEVPVETLVEDNVFYAALLSSNEGVTVKVSIGGEEIEGPLSGVPKSGAGTTGVYTGSVPFGTRKGDVVVTVERDGAVIGTAEGGAPIVDTCTNNVQNWNAVAV